VVALAKVAAFTCGCEISCATNIFSSSSDAISQPSIWDSNVVVEECLLEQRHKFDSIQDLVLDPPVNGVPGSIVSVSSELTPSNAGLARCSDAGLRMGGAADSDTGFPWDSCPLDKSLESLAGLPPKSGKYA
jgi:hypothetical protein